MLGGWIFPAECEVRNSLLIMTPNQRRLDGWIAINVCDCIHEACACDVQSQQTISFFVAFPMIDPKKIQLYFLVAKTQVNHWTKRVVRTLPLT